MKIDNSKLFFLVLVPHRDTRLVLRNYSETLLKTGLEGAYAVPWVAPLAALSRTLNSIELRKIAHTIKKTAVKGKFRTEGAYTLPFSIEEKNKRLFGLRLNIKLPQELLNGAGVVLSPVVIGSCLLSGEESETALPCPPELSFSAAAIANMIWRPVKLTAKNAQKHAFGYKWKMGKLLWLPKQTRLPKQPRLPKKSG